VILPDHLHLFVALPDNVKLGDWIGTLKRFLAQAVEVSCSSGPIWQRGFFDHLLRSSESYSEKWNYVREIPFAQGSSPTRMIGDTVVRSSPFNMTNSASGFAVFLLRSAKANVAKTRAPRRPEVGGYNPRAFE